MRTPCPRRCEGKQKPGQDCRPSGRSSTNRVCAALFSDLFNVVASRPAKSPRGDINAPAAYPPSRPGKGSCPRTARRKLKTPSSPSTVRTICSLPHLSIKARLCRPACFCSIASRASLVGLMTRSVHGHGASMTSAPTRNADLPVCHQAIVPRRNASRARPSLHDGAAFVRALPFSEKGAVLKPEPGRLLDATDIDRSPRENGRYGKREISDNHDAVCLPIRA